MAQTAQDMVMVSSASIPATGACTATTAAGTSAAPGTVLPAAPGTTFVCLNNVSGAGDAAGDYAQTVTLTWGPSVPASSTWSVSVFVGGVTVNPMVFYLGTGATVPATNTVVFTWDLGGLPTTTTITTVSDLVTSCGATAAPTC